MPASISYDRSSFYRGTNINNKYLDIWESITVLKDSADKKISIPPQYHKRPDLLSFAVYGTVDYWWIFPLRNFNYLIDPIEDFVSGLEIYIPQIKNITNKRTV